MVPVMIGPLILLAPIASPLPRSAEPAGTGAAAFQPVSSVSASATVTIRIVSGVRFGQSQVSGDAGAIRRRSELADPSGLMRPTELLEFQ
jgi:hypothetical protein